MFLVNSDSIPGTGYVASRQLTIYEFCRGDSIPETIYIVNRQLTMGMLRPDSPNRVGSRWGNATPYFLCPIPNIPTPAYILLPESNI